MRSSFIIHSCPRLIVSFWINAVPGFSCHFGDVVMGDIASQITSLAIVCSTVYSGTDQRKHQSSASLVFVRGIHRWIPAQMASNAENISIWWRHHAYCHTNFILLCTTDTCGDMSMSLPHHNHMFSYDHLLTTVPKIDDHSPLSFTVPYVCGVETYLSLLFV